MVKFTTNKRKINNNFEKFKAIANYEDFIELAKEMSKLVRKSWKNEKKKENEATSSINEASLTEVIVPNEERAATEPTINCSSCAVLNANAEGA